MAIRVDNDAPGDIGEPKQWKDSFFEESRTGRPWENRVRYVEPQRTWSGKVVYFRKRKPFTEADVIRIISRITPEPTLLDRAIALMESFFSYAEPLKETIIAAKDGDTGKVIRVLLQASFDTLSQVLEIFNVSDAVDTAMGLITDLSDSFPEEDQLEIIKKVDYNLLVDDYEGKIQDLVDENEELKKIIAGLEEASYGRKG